MMEELNKGGNALNELTANEFLLQSHGEFI